MLRNPSVEAGTEIPVIDVGSLLDGSLDHYRQVGNAIRKAATEVGFFYVANHGVPEAVIAAALGAGREFFSLPLDRKNEAAINSRHRGFVQIGGANVGNMSNPDLKETFSWGLEIPEDDPDVQRGIPLLGPNNWPESFPELQAALYNYFLSSFDCGDRLLRAIAVSLNMDPDFFSSRYTKPFARGQVIHYPPRAPDSSQQGIGEHTDFGCLTLLWQDQNGGLEILNRRKEWVAARPIEGTLVVNVGDLLQRWSNDRFISNFHRVNNSSGRDRFSMTVFYDPNYDTVVDPRDMALSEDDVVLYEPVIAGEHVRGRFDATFAYRKQQR